jgi:phosphatidylglycerophosphatase A
MERKRISIPLMLVTLGGAGLLKPAPGTWGSLAATIALYIVHRLTPISTSTWNGVLLAGMFLLGFINVVLGPWIAAHFQRKDPGACVIDEGAGMCLTLLAQPVTVPWETFLAAFIAFRVFDILKPPPARRLEKLPAGWGILLDDLAAAVYANLLCQIVLRII